MVFFEEGCDVMIAVHSQVLCFVAGEDGARMSPVPGPGLENKAETPAKWAKLQRS